MLQKILIANRGEIAIRIAQTCKKLNLIPCGIYSDADRHSLHVKYCKDAINIGGRLPQESYLDITKIIDAAKKLDCNSIHPGYGFLSENQKFAKICKGEGITFIGSFNRGDGFGRRQSKSKKNSIKGGSSD